MILGAIKMTIGLSSFLLLEEATGLIYEFIQTLFLMSECLFRGNYKEFLLDVFAVEPRRATCNKLTVESAGEFRRGRTYYSCPPDLAAIKAIVSYRTRR